jgi:hypothetical protein
MKNINTLSIKNQGLFNSKMRGTRSDLCALKRQPIIRIFE